MKVENLIIGAGPGGLAAARELAAAGREVLVLDQVREVGRKICAGYLPENEEVRSMGIPQQIIRSRVEVMDLITPRRRVRVDISSEPRVTFRREDLGRFMAEEAEKAGAEIRLDARVVKISREQVELQSGERIGFQRLIGADGAMSRTRRFLGLPEGIQCGVVQSWVKERSTELKMRFDARTIGVWPAYGIPNGEYTIYGLGGDRDRLPVSRMKSLLKDWLSQNGHEGEHRIEGFPLRFSYFGHRFGNIRLVGEAAGLINSVTAIGIHPAYLSGIEVAREIIDPSYPAPAIRRMVRMKNVHHLLLGWGTRLPWLTGPLQDLIPSFMNQEGLRRKFLQNISSRSDLHPGG